MDVTQYVTDKLQSISKLLTEIEDILCENVHESKLTKGKKSVRISGLEPTDNGYVKKDVIRQMYFNGPDRLSKSDNFNWKKTPSDVNDSDSNARKMCKKNHKNKKYRMSSTLNDVVNNRSNKNQIDNARKSCSHEQFKTKLNETTLKFMKYFQKFNNDE